MNGEEKIDMSITNLDFDDLASLDYGGAVNSQRRRLSLDPPTSPISPRVSPRQKQSLDAPTSPISPREPYYIPVVGLTIGQTSPGGRSWTSDVSSSYSRNQSHSVNAVHMHVQENAKIPLLNQAVDRSNSSRPSYTTTAPSAPPTESMVPDPADFSMAELFLNKESRQRRSREQNYESLGAILLDDIAFDEKRRLAGDTGVKGNVNASAAAATTMDETHLEIDALTAAIDPTPWSEIEQKMHNDQEQSQQQVPPRQPTPAPPTSHPYHYSYYPYERQHQLPIPQKSSPQAQSTRPPPSPSSKKVPAIRDPTFSQALATAAAIASTQVVTNRVVKPPAPPPPNTSQIAPVMISAPPYTKAQQTPPTHSSTMGSTIRNYQGQRASYTPPQHAVAHTTSRASVIAATNQKSQYGFGGNHTIPSVPAPPPMATNAHANKFAAPNTKMTKTPMPPLPEIPDLLAHDNTPPNTGAAYERKKQRAKDARIKLNDAIERLSIAMNLAGSQSKQRSLLLASRVMATAGRTKTMQINDECVKMSEQAKKWDRPSFVGTAASVMQGLNSQCESLVRELVMLQERLDAATGNSSSAPTVNGDVRTSHPEHKRHAHPHSSVNGAVKHANKRMRGISDNEEINGDTTHHVDVTSDEKVIYGGVAVMLDPISLSRCPCVSRRWRDMQAFESDELWLNLAVKRFGFYNVRQWTENLEDGDVGVKDVTKKALYRAMNAANVMPHMQQDGVSLMGDAKIPGRISGWVYMVERSNGETLRSVKREPGITGSGNGAYQSRPVVELRIIVQNTGMSSQPIVIKNQQVAVDISTRRSGGELKEIHWDERFTKLVKQLDGTKLESARKQSSYDMQRELCCLGLFEAAILEVHINARGCSTTSKFQQRSNFTKLLVSLDGTTVPMVIPFLRDGSHGNH